jgi:hypothetical protein
VFDSTALQVTTHSAATSFISLQATRPLFCQGLHFIILLSLALRSGVKYFT